MSKAVTLREVFRYHTASAALSIAILNGDFCQSEKGHTSLSRPGPGPRSWEKAEHKPLEKCAYTKIHGMS